MSQADVQIILQILIVIIGLYLVFFKSYIQEKGKNLATKEDIELITQKIEKVKSDIGILTHKKISLSSEKQSSLLDFISKYAAWLNYIMRVSIICDSDPANTYTEKINEKLDQLYYDVEVTETKIDVFFSSDDELVSKKNEIKLKTIELSNHLSIAIVDVEGKTNTINIFKSLPNEIPDNSYKMQELKKEYEGRNKIFAEYKIQQLALYKQLSPLYYELVEIISHRVHDYESA